jgi:hypothetical protein
MNRNLKILAATVVMGWSLTSAQGGAAIVTLTMPPAGDGHSALHTGAAIPSGLASAWYNPALLAGLRVSTGSNIHITASHQDLIASTQQDFSGMAVVYPGLGSDFGIAIYQNSIDFGESIPPDGSRDGESVYGLAAGFGVARALSLGLAAKYYRSELGTASSDGWAFDGGLLASEVMRPLKGLPSFETKPSIGMAIRNFGSDAWYVDPSMSDPLPRTWSNGLGLEVAFADIVHVTIGHDWDREIHRRSDWSDSWIRTYGYTASILGFRYGSGRHNDHEGGRNERHVMREYEFNLERVLRVLGRLQERDVISASKPSAGRIPGTGLRANPRLVVGSREIVSGARDGQDSWYFSVSL